MRISVDVRRIIVTGVAAALLAGCGGSSLSTGGLPPSNATLPASLGKSWMSPEAKSSDLLYASIQNTCCASGGADVDVFSYPKGKLVGQLSVTQDTMFGLCSDSKGDVFVTAYDTSQSGQSTTIYEYAHGGTTPIRTFADPYAGDACSVDPTTGNLAVANWFTGGSKQSGNVLIYNVKSRQFTTHAYWQIRWYRWCAYDTNGDLYVDGQNGNGVKLAVLRKGHHAFEKIFLSDSGFVPYSLQWNGDSLVVANYEVSIGPETLAEVHVSGSKGTIVHRTALRDRGKIMVPMRSSLFRVRA